MTDQFRVAFVCVQNAGRSQMSTAFDEREGAERGLSDHVDTEVRDWALDDPGEYLSVSTRIVSRSYIGHIYYACPVTSR